MALRLDASALRARPVGAEAARDRRRAAVRLHRRGLSAEAPGAAMMASLWRVRARIDRIVISPRQFALLAYLALGALTLIVLSGAAVRLTGSGLGCPDW